jgi:hypothetical protein
MVAKQIQVIQHLLNVPDLALANFCLFSRVKRDLAGLTLNQKTFNEEWGKLCGLLMRQTLPSGGIRVNAAKSVSH